MFSLNPYLTARRASERGAAAPSDWTRTYARRLRISDAIVIAVVVFGTHGVWFGELRPLVTAPSPLSTLLPDYSVVSVVLAIVWMVALSMTGSRERRIVGVGADEYRRVTASTIQLFAVVAVVAFIAQVDFARGYVLLSLPAGLVALLATRWLWRQWLVAQRRKGLLSSRTIVVGSRASVAAIVRKLHEVSPSEFLVTGLCLLDPPAARRGRTATIDRGELDDLGVPVVGRLDDVVGLLESTASDTVLVTSTDMLPPERVRDLSWRLRPGDHHLLIAPSLMDIGGPRIHTRPVAGLPLLHIETPRHQGPKSVVKRVFDLMASVLLVAALSPLLVGLALIIRVTSPGPAIFVQERIGAGGAPFRMLKFRSMINDAENRLDDLLVETRDSGNEVLFKMRDDPRVTPVGRFMRRWSLDELPQLFNVIDGTMSLVGPRPPLQREVDAYELHVHRRFFVKPGITGLWQISGRSSLTWEESVRLDLYYVENWSLTIDLLILWRTFAAVVRRVGAY